MKRTLSAATLLLLGALAGCKEEVAPAPEKAPVALPPAPSSAASLVQAPAVEPPTFELHTLQPTSSESRSLHPIDGAILVAEGLKMGRLVGEGIEWLDKTVPDLGPAVGGSHINRLSGRWPDAVDLFYASNQGRAPMPSYHPLTGKGLGFTYQPGGGAGYIAGTARVGESLILAGYSSQDGYQFVHVRGPKAMRFRKTPAEAGCKPGEVTNQEFVPPSPAIRPDSFGGTRAGTVMSFGALCEKRGPAMEIWDEGADKSRIEDLSRFAPSLGYQVQFLDGPTTDEVWVFSRSEGLVLHYVNDRFEATPRLATKLATVFTSPDGKLHGSDGRAIYRLDEGAWKLFGRLPWRYEPLTLAHDGQGLWLATGGDIHRLKEGPRVVHEEGCATPFVYLYDVAYDNAPDFTFPSTRKALATFPGAAELSLVEFREGRRRLGVEVASKAQAEALMAHVRATMKDEAPELYCYRPRAPRRIAITAK
jgi:hypothetical protein